MRKRILKYLGLIAALNISTSNAEQSVIGAWEVKCEKAACMIGQGVVNSNDAKSKFGITISSIPSSHNPIAQINTPLGLYIPQGLGIEIGTFRQAVPFITCLPNGCKSIFELNEEVVKHLNSSSQLNVRFYTSDSRQKQISFSLDSFEKAYAYILKH